MEPAALVARCAHEALQGRAGTRRAAFVRRGCLQKPNDRQVGWSAIANPNLGPTGKCADSLALPATARIRYFGIHIARLSREIGLGLRENSTTFWRAFKTQPNRLLRVGCWSQQRFWCRWRRWQGNLRMADAKQQKGRKQTFLKSAQVVDQAMKYRPELSPKSSAS